MRGGQRGASGIFVAVILLLIGVAALAAMALSRGVAQNERSGQSALKMKAVQDALVQFVAANGRLPCPANPAADTGDEVRDGALVGCTNAAGSVPWKTIGLRRDDSLDPWTNKISYRVYLGSRGTLTQNGGASMLNCDLVETVPTGVTTPSANSGGLCQAAQDTPESAFLFGKGLTVNAFGTAITNAAYVLISHGPTGRGAFTSAGSGQAAPTNTHELSNVSAAGPFYAETESAAGISADDAAHFDDVLAYAKLDELIRKAGQGGRDWPEPPAGPGYAGIQFNAATLAGILGSTPGTGSLGTNTITFPTATVTAFNSSGAQNFSFTTSGVDGIGVAGGTISSNNGEYVRIVFGQKARKFGLSVMNFGAITIAATLYRERVTLTFYDGATSVGSVTRQACTSGSTASASFSVDAPADFDRVEIRPITATPIGLLNSSFYITEIKSCPASATACLTSLAVASPATVCP